MNRAELEALAAQYQQKSEKAYMNYQETGMARYDREYRKNEDLADAMRMAADAADEHTRYVSIRGDVASLASLASFANRSMDSDIMRKLVGEVLAVARIYGLIRDS